MLGTLFSENMAQLRRLKLDFGKFILSFLYGIGLTSISCWKITDKGVEALAIEISNHLIELESLSLHINSYYTLFNKSPFANHFFFLSSFPVYSYCLSCHVTNKGFKPIGTLIVRRLTRLQKLNLDFHG